MQSQQKADPRPPLSLLALLTHRGRGRGNQRGGGERRGERQSKGRKAKGERIKGLWNRNQAAGVLADLAQMDPEGIFEVHFQGSHG